MNGDAELLHALALALTAEGWTCRLIALDGPVRLRVVDLSVPFIGETVKVMAHREGPWFQSSTGEPMAACSNLPGATAYVDRVLGAQVRPRVPV
jgi:hypothetical protein